MRSTLDNSAIIPCILSIIKRERTKGGRMRRIGFCWKPCWQKLKNSVHRRSLRARRYKSWLPNNLSIYLAIDIVISHTAPESVVLPEILCGAFYDPSRAVLEAVLRRYKPTLWFCGHFHIAFKQKLLDGACTFVALACAPEYGGIVLLEDVDQDV